MNKQKLKPLAGLLMLAFSFSTTACVQANASSSDAGQDSSPAMPATLTPPTAAQIADLRAFLESYGYVGSYDNRDPKYNPENVLPKVHPWLTPRNGLRYKTMGDGYSAYLLKPLPANVLHDLTGVLYPDSSPIPLQLLRASFWVKVKELQDEGFAVGFKVYTQRSADVGVYFNDSKTIIFDVFAEYGTLSHEYEHYIQYQNLAASEDEYVSSPDLSNSCIQAVGRFLGEVDATRIELPLWNRSFSTFDYKPARYKTLTDDMPVDVHFFYGNMLTANLSYPAYAANWVAQSNCPKVVKDAASAIANQASTFENKMLYTTMELSAIQAKYFRSCVDANTTCKKDASLLTPDEKKTCDADQSFVSQMDLEAQTVNTKIDSQLQDGYRDRTAFVKTTLAQLPEEYQAVFCKNALAYSILGDCP